MTLIVVRCSDFASHNLRMYKAAAVLSALLKACTISFHDMMSL